MAVKMTGINLSQLKTYVVQPVLAAFPSKWNSRSAEVLLIGTALCESNGGTYLHQLGSGPAVGPWEMEPATHDDCYTNFLAYQTDIYNAVKQFTLGAPVKGATQMAGNLYYAAAMCRVRYIRAPDALPAADDYAGLASYWKRFYNSALGAGTVDARHIGYFQQAAAA